MQVGPRTRRNLWGLESFDFECSAADCIQSYVPAASLRIAADDIDKVNRTRYREGRPQGRLSYFQPPASAWPFRSQEAPLRSIQAPANMGSRVHHPARGAAAAWPLAARAQQGERMRRIGVLMNLAADDPEAPDRITAGCSENLIRIYYVERARDSAASCLF